MALELGLKLNNATSVSELHISKNTASPVFVSTETHSSFILTCYLKGYDRNSFQIKISENGKEISISGEKPIQELLMMGRVMLKKNVQIVGFKKVFEIPDAVVLDRIKAKFDEDESLLKIVMAKLVKGIYGVQIEEVKKEEFGESSQKASSETRENECVCRKEEGLSDKKLEESTNGDVIEGPRFEAMKESELRENIDHVPESIGGESIMLGRPHGTTREDEFEGIPREEIGEAEFKNGGKDDEKVPTEMSKEEFEAIETSKEEEESKKVFTGKIEEGEVEEPKSEDEDRGKQREETEETKFECAAKDKERVNKGRLEARDTTKEEREYEDVLAGAIRIDEKGRIDKNKQREVEEAKLETEGKDEEMEVSKDGIAQKEIEDEDREKESEAAKFEIKGKDEEKAPTEMIKKGIEAIETSKEEEESKKVFAGKIEEGEVEELKSEAEDRGEQREETEEMKFECEGKDKGRVSKGGLEAIDTTKEEREYEDVLAGAIRVDEKGRIDKNKKREVEEAKLETEGKDEGMEVSKDGIAQKEIEDEDRERKGEAAKFEIEGKDEEKVPTEMCKKGFEAIETSKEEEESKKVFAGKIEEPKSEAEDRGEQREETEEMQFECEGKDKERVSKGGLEAIDTTKEEREYEDVLAGAIRVDEKGRIDKNKKREVEEAKLETEGKDEEMEVSKDGIEQKEIEDEDRERESEAAKFEIKGKDEEKAPTEMSKKGFEAIETSKEEEESKKVFAGKIEEPKSEAEDRGEQREETEEMQFECEGKDKERVSKGGLEAIDTTKEEREYEEVLAGAIRVDEKGRIDKNKQREVEEAKLETEGKDEEMEVSKDGIEQKEIEDEDRERESEEAMFEIKGKDEEKVLVGKIGVSEEEGTEQRETDETKFEIEDRDKIKVEQVLKGTHEKEIENNEFAVEGRDEETMGPAIMEEVEAKDATIEGGVSEKLFSDATGVSEKDIFEGTKKREIGENEEVLKEEVSKEDFEARKTKIKESPTREPKLPIQLEESEGKKLRDIEEPKILECATSKRQNLVEIEEATKAEGILEEAEGEEQKMSKEANRVDGNDYASDSGKKEIEESAIRSSRDGHVQENIVNTSKFPKQMYETKAQREKEVKVKEEIIVIREKEVKVKEVIVRKYDEAKEGFYKATTVGKSQSETGQPSDGRGFDNETLEAAKWDKTKACEEGYVETGPFMEERTKKEIEDPRVETKHKAQHHVQELPKKIAESMDEREGPKDTKIGEIKEAKRKSENEETQVVANGESTIEKKIGGVELERISRTNQFEKSLQEVPEEKDQEALRKDMREREIMMSTQHSEVKEIDKVCEECKRSEANLEREKWRTTQSVKDEKPRRENAVEHLEEKVPYPELRKEEVEGARLKELPPPKEKKNMKWKSPKTQKLEPKATEGEEYEAGRPPEVKSSSSSQQSMVDKEKSEIEIPKSNTSGTPSEEKEIEHFKTLTEDRGHYLLDTEKRLEAKEVSEEEKLNQKDEAETLSCKRERTKIVECKDEKSKTKRNGSEEINQIKAAAEEFRDVLANSEIEKSQEILLPQTAEIQGKEKISEIRQVQQEQRREIPFQANEESEAVISTREAESQKPNDAHPKESTIKFDSDKPKGEVDNGRHLEFQEPEKQEFELDFQESTRRRSDQEVEKTHFSQQEENHEGHAIEEEKDGEEAENVAHVEISEESEDLEDIEVEASGKKVEPCVPMVFAGSVFIASLIIFFFRRKGAQKR